MAEIEPANIDVGWWRSSVNDSAGDVCKVGTENTSNTATDLSIQNCIHLTNYLASYSLAIYQMSRCL